MTVEKYRITGASRYSIEFAGRVSSLQFALSAAGMPLLGVFLDRRGLLAEAAHRERVRFSIHGIFFHVCEVLYW